MNRMKKIVGSLALGAVLATSVAVPSFAQDWRRDNNRWDRRDDRRDNRWDKRYNNRNANYARQELERGYRDGLS